MDTPIQLSAGIIVGPLDGAVWRKSRYSGTHGNCVEVARDLSGVIAIRDSQNPDGPMLFVTPAEWRGFLRRLGAQ